MNASHYIFAVLIIFALLGLTALAAIAGELERDKVEKPRYTVLMEKESYEIRRYEPYIVAQVMMEGSEEDAMSRGFRPLADYIFGSNEKKSEIAMTAPVIAQEPQSEKIAMTSPVTQRQRDNDDNTYNVAFIMPSDYTMETLPTPKNDSVELLEMPAETRAVIRFSGWGRHDAMEKHEQRLREALEKDRITVSGTPIYARYDPPWTLPNLRRNEVMIPIALQGNDESES